VYGLAVELQMVELSAASKLPSEKLLVVYALSLSIYPGKIGLIRQLIPRRKILSTGLSVKTGGWTGAILR